MNHWLPSGVWFGAVGAAAALTHLAVFGLARPALWPELANALGFAVAFGVSYLGHRHLSFRDTRHTTRQSLPRFALTALAGFALNEAVFILLHRALHWPAWPALLLALVLAAAQTYALGRWWAFRR